MPDSLYSLRKDALEVAVGQIDKLDNLSSSDLEDFLEHHGVIEISFVNNSHLPRHIAPAKVGKFVIRNDVLLNINNFFVLIKAASKIAIGAKGIVGAPVVLDALHDLYKLYSTLKDQAFVLTSGQMAVVSTLRDLGHGTAAEIANLVTAPTDPVAVEAMLKNFERSKDLAHGIAERDEDGVWKLISV